MTNVSPIPSARHPFLELCQESDLLDIKITPSGPGGGYPVGVEAKALTGTSRVYALALRHGLRGVDADGGAAEALWVVVDGVAARFSVTAPGFGADLEGADPADRPQVIEALHRLAEIHAAADRIVDQFVGIAEGHVYSLLNGLAAQAGKVYPEGAVPRTWEDALEHFGRLCRSSGLSGVSLSAAAGGLSLVDATARVAEVSSGASHELSVTWSGWDDGLPARMASLDGSSTLVESDEGGFEDLVAGVPEVGREGLQVAMSQLVRLSDLAGQVVLGHSMSAAMPDAAGEAAASDTGAAEGAGLEALETLNGLAQLHTGR